jgi:DNA-binding IclR family transcriptional regulator
MIMDKVEEEKMSRSANDIAGCRSVYRIQVLERTFDLIDALSDDESELALSELSQRLHLHRSTTHRLLTVLSSTRYVEKNPASGKYRLGSKLMELGTKVAARLNLPAIARPFLQQLVDETGETAHLGILRQADVVSITNVESSRTLRAPATVGRRTPALASSQGKCLLAFLPEAELEPLIGTFRWKAYTPHTITRPADLRVELRRVRQRGYALDDEEYEEGLKCIGAPVFDHSGAAVAAISIAGPAARLRRPRMPALTASVLKAAGGLSAAIGFTSQARQAR